jgi:arsenate reductase (thioredoxin)
MLRAGGDGMSRACNVLILCTGNSARSILAEAILNREGAGRFRAFSAGSRPKGQVHPMAMALLRDKGFATGDLRSKSWDEFAGEGAPSIDFVFTVCGNAAGEACPHWPGAPVRAHWGIDDPAAVEGPGQRAAFEKSFGELEARIARFLALPIETMDRASLGGALREIGETNAEPHAA